LQAFHLPARRSMMSQTRVPLEAELESRHENNERCIEMIGI